MKAAFRFIKAIPGVFVLVTGCAYAAEENCNSWRTAEVDPTKGRYLLELRSCDLTYGLSAYVQIKNSSDARVALSYRVITKDDKYKDSEIILEPGRITRAENCQVCASRHAGLKSWEILTAGDAPADKADEKAVAVKPATLTPATPAVVVNPVAPAPVAAKPVVPEPVKPAITPVTEKPVAGVVPAKSAEQVKTEAAAPEKKVDGFKAEDGTIIPWDKLPPEFRPRK